MSFEDEVEDMLEGLLLVGAVALLVITLPVWIVPYIIIKLRSRGDRRYYP